METLSKPQRATRIISPGFFSVPECPNCYKYNYASAWRSLVSPRERRGWRKRKKGRTDWKREWNKNEKGDGSRRRRRSGWMCSGLYELWGFPTVTHNRWRQVWQWALWPQARLAGGKGCSPARGERCSARLGQGALVVLTLVSIQEPCCCDRYTSIVSRQIERWNVLEWP